MTTKRALGLSNGRKMPLATRDKEEEQDVQELAKSDELIERYLRPSKQPALTLSLRTTS